MKKFTPDMRNLGGRKVIVDLMNNHYACLLNIKPVINTRDQPHPHVNNTSKHSVSGTQPKSKNEPDLAEVREGFRRVANVKRSSIDTTKPGTFSMSTKLSEYRQRKKQSIKSDHMNNIKHMQRRINDIGSLQERKKNKYDPIANPVMFFRSVDETDHPTLNDKFISKVLRPPKTSDIYSYMAKQTGRRRTTRPKSAEGSMEEEISMTPSVHERSNNPQLELKKQLLEVITNNRIYTDKDLEELFLRTREANSHLSPDIVEDAIAYVQSELDS
ncbi:unnamed protein product [Blepharisma stoltei]|uniref:Uncharacterized protein n=1 Tax=Blepharisma stoltei TaxID=1481888 RepID=A0AAU9JVK6_9CILI|nr:unnamed protein product [Blepharisma stoltei]